MPHTLEPAKLRRSALDDAGAFRVLARSRLSPDPVAGAWNAHATAAMASPARSDWDLNPELRAELEAVGTRAAAVLVPVIARNGLTVLLTQRTTHLKSHAGQISFPGGKIEPDDASPIDAAIREAEEEIGLERNFIEPLGYLDTYQTGTGFRVTPVVALIRDGFALRCDPSEVADAFEVPLAFLMDEANHQRHERIWKDKPRKYYAMPFGERYIWGATAGMIRNLYDRLFLP